MIFKCFFATIIILVVLISCNRDNQHLKYIDVHKPNLVPRLFSPDFISFDSISEFGSVFSKSGDRFYYGVDIDGKAEIRFTQLKNGSWSKPITILSDSVYGINDPFLSVDEKRLYYISDMPRNESDTIRDYDIWYSTISDDVWSEPINAGLTINSDMNEYYVSFNLKGDMFYASNIDSEENKQYNYDIYKSEFRNNVFDRSIKQDSVNTHRYEADVFVAPDESYMIFCAIRKSGLGIGDLYISFKDHDGNWRKPKNLGAPINSLGHELCPFVTRDGKYFFYTSHQDIYWVDAAILNKYKD